MLCQVSMIVDGQCVPKIKHNRKTFLAVEPGKKFALEIKNVSHKRICVVVSVDGLSIMDGERADHNSDGYVIDAHRTVMLKGWRKSDSEVAQFEITNGTSASYAAMVGKGENVGVIGVVAYTEKTVRPQYVKTRDVPKGRRSIGRHTYSNGLEPHGDGLESGIVQRGATSSLPIGKPMVDKMDFDGGFGVSDALHAFPPTKTQVSAQMAGTGHGERVSSIVHTVSFERSQEKEVIVLYYDTIDSLRARGVPVDLTYAANPFPAEPQRNYCPDP